MEKSETHTTTVKGERLRSFSCNQCERKFRYRYELHRHLRRRDHQQFQKPLKEPEFEKLEAEIKEKMDQLNDLKKRKKIRQLQKELRDLGVKIINI